MNYETQLRDPRWHLVRRKVYENARWRCQLCGKHATWLREHRGQSLEAHHSYYDLGKMAWDYPMSSMVALCKDCHSKVVHRDKYEAAVTAAVDLVNANSEELQQSLDEISETLAYAEHSHESLKDSTAIQAHCLEQALAYAIVTSCGGEMIAPARELDPFMGNYILSRNYDGSSHSIFFNARHIYDGQSAFGVRISSRSNDARILDQMLAFVKLLKSEDLHGNVEEVFHDSKFNTVRITVTGCAEEDAVAERIFSHAYRAIDSFEWFGSVQGRI